MKIRLSLSSIVSITDWVDFLYQISVKFFLEVTRILVLFLSSKSVWKNYITSSNLVGVVLSWWLTK